MKHGDASARSRRLRCRRGMTLARGPRVVAQCCTLCVATTGVRHGHHSKGRVHGSSGGTRACRSTEARTTSRFARPSTSTAKARPRRLHWQTWPRRCACSSNPASSGGRWRKYSMVAALCQTSFDDFTVSTARRPLHRRSAPTLPAAPHLPRLMAVTGQLPSHEAVRGQSQPRA